MSFSLGSVGSGMGPRNAINEFGREGGGPVFDPRLLRRLLQLVQPYRWQILAALAAMLVSSVLALATPWLIKNAIDRDIAGADATGLLQTVLLMMGAAVGAWAASSFQQYLLSNTGLLILADLRLRLFRHLQHLSLSYHHSHIVGVTISRVISDVAVIHDLLTDGVATLIGDTIVLVGIMLVMLSLNVPLALVSFSVLPLMLLATWWFSRRARAAFRQTRQRLAAVVGGLAEDISGIRVIQAFAREGVSAERFDEVNRANRDAYVEAMSLSFTFLPAVDFLGVLAIAIVLWWGGAAVSGGGLTLGVVVAFLAYVTRFFQPIQELSQLYTTLQSAMAGGERVFELLDTHPVIEDSPEAVPLPRVQGRVEFRHVGFEYQSGSPVLQDIQLTVDPGKTVAIVGPTGAGKTTLASLITRFYDATTGTVLVDGHDVRTVTQHSLRSNTGLVSQDPFLFSGTVADNIRFGHPQATLAEIQEASRAALAHEFITRLPAGYSTRILEGGVNLSIGQRQLICIARAILADPRLLILDEATASIDTMTESLLQEALYRLLRGRTSIVIAHRLTTIRNADHIVVLQAGRIVEQGTHDELVARNGLYTELHQRQFLAS
ncbi:MAG TPA: ABC transporter ATP-binding protein [Candidatus Ozemobacteraceae bacterium]|nr:ABC transporter ATP-binding protein [Candidatus Ozemobacteraceae bacterium]